VERTAFEDAYSNLEELLFAAWAQSVQLLAIPKLGELKSVKLLQERNGKEGDV